ncbi:beta family protein [Caballeronia sp. GAWG1-1]|uniref:beta family protein n=1 Tax=Caballeronia sp. GAWG1-1 TaxID=2921742 RepID=UPI0020278B31|nr:beta family protein [Caballeronia sp. GAWG1-1]
MEYVVALRVGQNDIKALTNLEAVRKERVAPLLAMRGKNLRHLDAFFQSWGDTSFYLDISRFISDASDPFLVEHRLNDFKEGFQAKRKFYEACVVKNKALVPVVGWADGDPTRAVVQCALILASEFKRIAVRIDVDFTGPRQWGAAQNILNSVADPSIVDLLIDFRKISSHPLIGPGSWLNTLITEASAYGVRSIVLISTSFPDDKPASGSARGVACLDLVWQTSARVARPDTRLVYGDYGATNPTGTMEFVPGMPVIPFANYLMPLEWWQTRQGGDKAFHQYTEIAQLIRNLPGYHGDDFCWATREISRIATTGAQYGNNGTWNGYRINQHVCAVLQ